MKNRKHNVRLDEDALINTTGYRNSAMGYKSLVDTGNCFIGWNAGYTSCDGDHLAAQTTGSVQDSDQWCAYCERLIPKGNTACVGCGAPLTRGAR